MPTDDSWKKLFNREEGSHKQMGYKAPREFIYDFEEERGGIENVTCELEQKREIDEPATPQPSSPMDGKRFSQTWLLPA